MRRAATRRRRSLGAWLVVLGAMVVSTLSPDPARALDPCDFGEEVPASRPAPEEGPTKVRTSIFVFDLVDIDTVNQQFTLDFFVQAEWTDRRLGQLAQQAGHWACEAPTDKIWTPEMIMVNSRDIQLEEDQQAFVHADGTVEVEGRITGTFSAPLDLTDFPLDKQTLPVTFVSTVHGPDELQIVFEGAGAEEELSEQGWSVRRGRAESGTYEMEIFRGPRKEEAEVFARFDYEILVKRRRNFYVWKVFVPLCVIVFASWAVFWVDPTRIEVQAGIGTAMMLTVIAFLFSLQQILPQINYLTRMDIFVYSSLLFVFLAFVEGLITYAFASHARKSLALRIDQISRVAFPASFLAVILWFWLG